MEGRGGLGFHDIGIARSVDAGELRLPGVCTSVALAGPPRCFGRSEHGVKRLLYAVGRPAQRKQHEHAPRLRSALGATRQQGERTHKWDGEWPVQTAHPQGQGELR